MEEGRVEVRGGKGGDNVKIGKTLGLGLMLLMALPPVIRAMDAGPRQARQRRIRRRMLSQPVGAPSAKGSKRY